jgi:hypothetical protein
MTTTARSRRIALLAGLAVLLVVVIVGRRNDIFGGSAAAPAGVTRTATPVADKVSSVADVRLELLQASRPDLDPATRNPFQFRARAVAPAPGSSQRFTPPVIISGPPPPPPAPPGPRPIPLKYIGVLETSQGQLAVFKDADGEIINGGEGDVLDGRYRLLKINAESADVAYTDGRGRQTIRLSGQ